MYPGIHNYSEIGKLNKVLLHRPGLELEALTPSTIERLLFDDIPYLKIAQQEHDTFANVLRENGVEAVVKTGVSDLLQGFTGAADLIAANIIADIILRLFDELADHLAPGGRLLASGIIDERLAEVEAAAAAHGLAIEQVMEDAGWAALVIRAGGNV